MSDFDDTSSFRVMTGLFWQPLSVGPAATHLSPTACVIVALCTWPIVLTCPFVGGSPNEPFASWGAYLSATVGFAAVWYVVMLIVVAPLSLALMGESPGRPQCRRRVLLLSAAPFLVPMLALVPLQVVGRSDGQIIPPPAWAGGWSPLGDIRLYLVFALCWIALVIHGWRVAIAWERNWARGHCTGCGYDRVGLGADALCPECGGAP